MYSTRNLYDPQINRNLGEPPDISPPTQGKIVMTLRVELKKTMTTAILKVPSGLYFGKEEYMNSM